ncbi:MAG: hypothetical protein HZB81_00905 [Deltaproteobacteria bacterium]|nr:hypothetical protein [Deltaproteobacteria bacterium]
MPKKRIILSVVIILIAAIGLYYILLMGGDRKAAQEAAELYIKAVRDRNFDVIYDLNSVSRKRKLFIERRSYDLKDSSAKKDELAKQAYDEQKASFDSAQPSFDLNSVWPEKFVFISGMKYRIVNAARELNMDNPTAFYIKRIDVVIEAEMEYLNKDTAPMYEGRNIKKAVYLIKMIHSKNITRAVKDIAVDDKWLFKGVAVKQGSAVYIMMI